MFVCFFLCKSEIFYVCKVSIVCCRFDMVMFNFCEENVGNS